MLELGTFTGFYFHTGRNIDLHDDETLAELWEIHREAYLAEWIAEKPGTRPFAWWRFDAPGPRRVVNPGQMRADAEKKRPGIVWVGDGNGHLVQWLEAEWEFLTRWKLLTKEERTAKH